jgi:hypothetical protein
LDSSDSIVSVPGSVWVASTRKAYQQRIEHHLTVDHHFCKDDLHARYR